MEVQNSNKRVRVDPDESDMALPDIKRPREDLFDILDDSDLCMPSQDLDSFMKSFEEEISTSSPATVEVVDLTGESQPELGYLLEASDVELGLPPSETELVRVTSDSSEFSELWTFEEQYSGYDLFDFGFGDGVYRNDINNKGEYVEVDGLFDFSDIGFGSSDFSWQPETLPAL